MPDPTKLASVKAIKPLLVRPIAFHPVLARICCSVNPALMLSQAIYWTERTSDPAGWFYKTIAEWEEELTLTRDQQEGARARLRALGFMAEEKRGMPAKLYFRVDLETIAEAIALYAENPHTSMRKIPTRKSRTQECGKPATTDAENPHPFYIAETTSEITSETTKARSALVDLPNWLSKESWNGFCEMRAKIRKPLTPIAIARLIEKLDGWRTEGYDTTAVLDNSIVNCWQDVWKPKTPPTKSTRQKSLSERLDEQQGGPEPLPPLVCTPSPASAAYLAGLGDTDPWSEVMRKIRPGLTANSFSTWFAPTKFLGVECDTLLVSVPNGDFTVITERYSEEIREALAGTPLRDVVLDYQQSPRKQPLLITKEISIHAAI